MQSKETVRVAYEAYLRGERAGYLKALKDMGNSLDHLREIKEEESEKEEQE